MNAGANNPRCNTVAPAPLMHSAKDISDITAEQTLFSNNPDFRYSEDGLRLVSQEKLSQMQGDVTPSLGHNGRIKSDSTTNVSDPVAKEFIDFLGQNANAQWKRVVKLFFMFMIPVVVVFAECGMLTQKALRRQALVSATNQGILLGLDIGTLVDKLQKERGMTSIYLTDGNRVAWNRVNDFQTDTDAALEKIQSIRWPGRTTDGKQFEAKENFREYLSRNRKRFKPILGINDRDTVAELRWYTYVTTKLIRWITRDIPLGGDDDNKLWSYFVAYELLFQTKDLVGLQRALGGDFFAKGHHTEEEHRWFTESVTGAGILLDFSLGHSKPNRQLFDDLSVQHGEMLRIIQGQLELIADNNATTTTGNTAGQFHNVTAQLWFDNMTAYMDVFLGGLEHNLTSYILLQLSGEYKKAQQDFNVAMGLLAFILIVCPMLCVWYVFSVSNVIGVIRQFAAQLVQQTAELDVERKRADRLLFQMLPPTVAQTLKKNNRVHAEVFDSVTIYFSDIVDFTEITADSDPIQVIEFLNSLYTAFDYLMGTFDVYKVETIGDAYMVASGVPLRNGINHAGEICKMALLLLELIRHFKIPHMPDRRLLLRIGVNSGPCAAGVVGSKMPRYCLLGDTINTASRMESCGFPLRVHITESCKQLLDELEGFECVKRGNIYVKGKGLMETWWLINWAGTNFYVDLEGTEKIVQESCAKKELYKSRLPQCPYHI